MATYLETVNNVLRRLREPTVSSVNESSYSAMIGVFVNDAKRNVEDAYNWNAAIPAELGRAVVEIRNAFQIRQPAAENVFG